MDKLNAAQVRILSFLLDELRAEENDERVDRVLMAAYGATTGETHDGHFSFDLADLIMRVREVS